MSVTAELKRKNGVGGVVDYVLVDDAENPDTALSDPMVDFGARDRLDTVIARLASVLAVLPAALHADGGLKVHPQSTVPVSGTVTVANPTTNPETGLATQVTLASVLAAVDGIEAKLDALQTELAQKLEPGGAVVVSGSVTASGPLTDTQLRASAVPISGPLTDAQLRAALVPVGDMHVLVPAKYDHLTLSYTGPDVTGVVYRQGGGSGTVVGTLTLGYSGGNLVTVART